jgi:hypothetical protein
MTKHIFINSIILSLSLLSTTVHSQNNVINFPAECSNARALAKLVNEFDEKVSLTMTSVRTDSDKEPGKHPLIMFINFKTKTWTMAERVDEDLFCIIATGVDVNPYVKKERK